MAEEIVIAPDPIQLREVSQLLENVKNGTKRAMMSAVNKTASSAAGSIRKRLVPIMGLKLKDIKPRVRVIKPSKTEAAIRLLDFNVKAIKGKARPDQQTEYAFSEKGDLHTLPATWFRQTVPKTGHTAYFVRSEQDGKIATKRLPIQELFIRSPRKGWESAPSVAEEEMRKARASLNANILSQVDRLLNRKKADR